MSNKQENFFDQLLEDEWDDMPEFIQEKKEPYAMIRVRFETEDDLNDFAKLIDQKLTSKTKSIWHPYRSHWGGINGKARWVDES